MVFRAALFVACLAWMRGVAVRFPADLAEVRGTAEPAAKAAIAAVWAVALVAGGWVVQSLLHAARVLVNALA